ncbi:hypothetical protein FQZ97_1017750 [compost metagenome]
MVTRFIINARIEIPFRIDGNPVQRIPGLLDKEAVGAYPGQAVIENNRDRRTCNDGLLSSKPDRAVDSYTRGWPVYYADGQNRCGDQQQGQSAYLPYCFLCNRALSLKMILLPEILPVAVIQYSGQGIQRSKLRTLLEIVFPKAL